MPKPAELDGFKTNEAVGVNAVDVRNRKVVRTRGTIQILFSDRTVRVGTPRGFDDFEGSMVQIFKVIQSKGGFTVGETVAVDGFFPDGSRTARTTSRLPTAT